MKQCKHKQQLVAHIFKGIVGQYCTKCSELVDAWREDTGSALSPGELNTVRRTTKFDPVERYERED